MTAAAESSARTVIYGLPAGEFRQYMEEVLYGGGRLLAAAEIDMVQRAAGAAGWHSFRVAVYDDSPPDFVAAVAV